MYIVTRTDETDPTNGVCFSNLRMAMEYAEMMHKQMGFHYVLFELNSIWTTQKLKDIA